MRLLSALVLVALVAIAPKVCAQGLSARFGYVRAVETEPLIVRVEIDDARCASGGPCISDKVSVFVEVRAEGDTTWHEQRAVRTSEPGQFEATFTSTVVPIQVAPLRGVMEIRARVLGRRGGLMVELGADEPLKVDVLKPREAREQEAVLDVRPHTRDALGLIGIIGIDTRAGSSARVRAHLALGVRLDNTMHVSLGAVVGPVFSRPDFFSAAGPIVLGIEGCFRIHTRARGDRLFSLFAEPFAAADFRFPGFDPGLGLRVGAAWNVTSDVALEASMGGDVVLFRAIDPRNDPSLGASGSIRVGARLGRGG